MSAGSTNYIQNTNTLQSGATAYPSFLYVGSTATISTATIINRIYLGKGTQALPAYTFDSDTNTGIYSSAADSLDFATGGAVKLQLLGGVVYPYGPINTVFDGSATAPVFSFANEAGSGMYRIGTGNIALTANGTKIIDGAVGSVNVTGADQQNLYVTSINGVQVRILASGNTDAYIQTQTNHPLHFTTNNGADAIKITTALEVSQPNQPSFLVTDGTGATDVTGDGTIYSESWPTEVYDQSNDFASSTFTAPITGRYYLSTSLDVNNILVTHSSRAVTITTSNRTYQSLSNESLAATDTPFSLNVVADMDTNDTATVTVQASGSTKTVDINASASRNYFSGSLIN